MAVSKIEKKIHEIIMRTIESESQSFTKDTAKSVDLTAPQVDGFTFLTWINPRGIGLAGSFYMTIFNQNQGRIWTVPAGSTTQGKVAATAVYYK